MKQRLVTTLKIEMLRENILPSTHAIILSESGQIKFSFNQNRTIDSDEKDNDKNDDLANLRLDFVLVDLRYALLLFIATETLHKKEEYSV